MKHFEFATANRIVFGLGSIKHLNKEAVLLGTRALLVTGKTPERLQTVLDLLGHSSISYELFRVAGEPTVELVEQGSKIAREIQAELVIAIGGGSVLDTGKAVAALINNPGQVLDYLEVVGAGQTLKRPSAAVIAVPTTAGTGAEVTRNAVLSVPEKRLKVSLRSPSMLPKLALIDPELTYSTPAAVTASTGLDALTQCLEPFLSQGANPLTDGFCREGIPRATRSLRQAYAQPQNAAAREDMALASLCGGLALANAGLGAVHGLAGPLGGMLDASHGELCAALLPSVMRVNLQALRSRNSDWQRFTEVARLLIGEAKATAEDGIDYLETLCQTLQMPRLTELGFSETLLEETIDKAQAASSMKSNPVSLSKDELSDILQQAL